MSSVAYPEIWRCASPALTSTSPIGDAASPAEDVVASPNCGICDTADSNRSFIQTNESKHKLAIIYSNQTLLIYYQFI